MEFYFIFNFSRFFYLIVKFWVWFTPFLQCHTEGCRAVSRKPLISSVCWGMVPGGPHWRPHPKHIAARLNFKYNNTGGWGWEEVSLGLKKVHSPLKSLGQLRKTFNQKLRLQEFTSQILVSKGKGNDRTWERTPVKSVLGSCRQQDQLPRALGPAWATGELTKKQKPQQPPPNPNKHTKRTRSRKATLVAAF